MARDAPDSARHRLFNVFPDRNGLTRHGFWNGGLDGHGSAQFLRKPARTGPDFDWTGAEWCSSSLPEEEGLLLLEEENLPEQEDPLLVEGEDLPRVEE